VVGTRTGLLVLHRAPPHHLEPGSAPRTEIAVPHPQFRSSAPDKLFYDKLQENFVGFYALPILSQNVLHFFSKNQ